MVQVVTTGTDLLFHEMFRDLFNGGIPGAQQQAEESERVPDKMYRPDFSRPFPHLPGPTPDVFTGLDEMLSKAAADAHAKGSYHFLMHHVEYPQRVVVRLVSEWEDKLPALQAAKEFTGVYNAVANQFSTKTGINIQQGGISDGLVPSTNATALGPSVFDKTIEWSVYDCTPESVTNSTRLIAAIEIHEPSKQKIVTGIDKLPFMRGVNKLPSLENRLEAEGFSRLGGPVYGISTPDGTGISFDWFSEELKWKKEVASFQEMEVKDLAERMRNTLMESGLKGTLHLAAFLNYKGMVLIPQLGGLKKILNGYRGIGLYFCKTAGSVTLDNFGMHIPNSSVSTTLSRS